MLDYIIKEPTVQATSTVIWLHGLGDSGAGFADIVPVLGLPVDHKIRFIFPHAPQQPVTINNGFVMRSWYDIKSMDLEGRADITTLQQSEILINQLIEQQIDAGIAASSIIIAGFSQGGVLSLYSALRGQHKLAGIVGLSCYLADGNLPQVGARGANATTPIFSSHGQQDMTVPFAAGKEAATKMTQAGLKVSWSQYPMEHWVCEEQLKNLGQWIAKRLN